MPTESPIEENMLIAMRKRLPWRDLKIECQKEIQGRNKRPYRVDFLVSSEEMGLKIVVECDGYEFHGKTKDQLIKDRRRDRDLQALGYKVFRFTGSEIWEDVELSAEEVMLQFDFEEMRLTGTGAFAEAAANG